MNHEPLAFRMRPRTIDEVVGQVHLLGEGALISRMVTAGTLQPMIFYGPPGTGKTSLATALAGSMELRYKLLNAVEHSKKDLQIAAEEAKLYGQLVLILDEFHRLDKGKQDFLLPYLESGKLIVIGATTANPYHSVNPAIRSRCHIFELFSLQEDEILNSLRAAIDDQERGLGHISTKLDDDAARHIASSSGGDLRSALNALELAVLSTPKNEDGIIHVDVSVAEICMQKKNFNHDRDGDAHYDVLSAFQKSIRGSDADAALHYLARLIEAGDLVSINRRLLVIAYEDIGLANPQAGARTLAAIQASERLGFPEARIPLANAVVELCLSPKSNSAYRALDAALADVRKFGSPPIPDQIRDAHYAGAKELDRGVGYLYPHDYEGALVAQQYLPDKLKDHRYLHLKGSSKFEKAFKDADQNIRAKTKHR
ncbi:replication-associated recombination protein A [Geomicrobium sp. JCM 19039]|uniref:replication-associated recombination protein A n=1 Tax=Geomicrobium sp. JCM 19039 TaxID=1460636 RepID=UPI00045F1E5F|nr:replication-associated recombination protein A [Geomicrobium sp. JCM 19039]GAK11328.1 ATPase [Geomicrobium sp. JCM 19039]